SIAAIPGMKERTVLLDGFSKAYAMTGWRLGYGAMRPDLAEHIARLITNSVSCTATFTQDAGVEALNGSQERLRAMMAEFRPRRARCSGKELRGSAASSSVRVEPTRTPLFRVDDPARRRSRGNSHPDLRRPAGAAGESPRGLPGGAATLRRGVRRSAGRDLSR